MPVAIAVSEMRAHHEWIGLGDMCPPEEFEHYMSLMDRETRAFRAEAVEKEKQREEQPE